MILLSGGRVSHLRAIVSRFTGITAVRGDDESRATFLATALGHAARSLPNHGPKVAGLDIHAPDWFVPVLGVTYLNNELNPGRIREELDGLRPTIVSTKGGLEIFNGALALVSLSNESIQAMARHSHVIIADWQRPRVQPTSLVAAANHVITVTKSKVPPERLVLSAQAPDLQKFHVGHEGNVRDGRDNFLVVNSASEYVRQCCDVSLRRLGVDAIDLYYQHRAVPEALAEGLSTAARFSWGSQHRIYLNFTDVQASHWSWNGGTFG